VSENNFYLLSRIVKEQPIVSLHTATKKHQAAPVHDAACWSFDTTHPEHAGGANRDRTGDLLLAKQALSQLSYGPA
jgi:hypothetical protein